MKEQLRRPMANTNYTSQYLDVIQAQTLSHISFLSSVIWTTCTKAYLDLKSTNNCLECDTFDLILTTETIGSVQHVSQLFNFWRTRECKG